MNPYLLILQLAHQRMCIATISLPSVVQSTQFVIFRSALQKAVFLFLQLIFLLSLPLYDEILSSFPRLLHSFYMGAMTSRTSRWFLPAFQSAHPFMFTSLSQTSVFHGIIMIMILFITICPKKFWPPGTRPAMHMRANPPSFRRCNDHQATHEHPKTVLLVHMVGCRSTCWPTLSPGRLLARRPARSMRLSARIVSLFRSRLHHSCRLRRGSPRTRA